jgi:hypothetical protein
VPVEALRWLDEIYIAYAWLVLNNFQLEPIEEYVAMLKHKKPEDFPGRVYPTPLRALGIPANALNDTRVDGLSLRLFNSARAFILAHELGHVHRGHRGSTIPNEEEADRFAVGSCVGRPRCPWVWRFTSRRPPCGSRAGRRPIRSMRAASHDERELAATAREFDVETRRTTRIRFIGRASIRSPTISTTPSFSGVTVSASRRARASSHPARAERLRSSIAYIDHESDSPDGRRDGCLRAAGRACSGRRRPAPRRGSRPSHVERADREAARLTRESGRRSAD